MAINFMPELKQVQEIKLNIASEISGNASLSFTQLPEDNCRWVLKDSYLNIEAPVKQGVPYVFKIDNSIAKSFGTDRLSLVIKHDKGLQGGLAAIGTDIIYPNPTSSILNIKLTELGSNLAEANIFSLTGTLVKKSNISSGKSEIDVSALSSAVYTIIVRDIATGKILLESKFIKE
jgi:hypothetical protein